MYVKAFIVILFIGLIIGDISWKRLITKKANNNESVYYEVSCLYLNRWILMPVTLFWGYIIFKYG